MNRLAGARRLASFILSTVLCGCRATVGTSCTEEELARATTPVYAADGTPSYPGQSLLLTSCGGGSFCHSEGATQRYAAPSELNFDAALADSPGFPDSQVGATRLLRIQTAIRRVRDDIFQSVLDGSMPPGEVGREVQGERYRVYLDDGDFVGTELPSLGTVEGVEILRNWLACGAPVVATQYAAEARACRGAVDCPVTHECDETSRACAAVGSFVPRRSGAAMPTWAYLYPAVIRPTCAAIASCHGASGAGGLDMTTSDRARLALVDHASVLPGCGTRVVPGEPARSFLVAKLEGTQGTGCGSRMPIGSLTLTAEQIELIRTWVTNGALDD